MSKRVAPAKSAASARKGEQKTVKCLRDIINNKEGPLLEALDRMKAVCTDCGALKQWNAYEDYMLACLYNRADAYDQKQNIEFPTSSQKGALSITPRFEQREVTKSLIHEIGDLEEAIIAKGKYETTWHDAALSVLRSIERKKRNKREREEQASANQGSQSVLPLLPLPAGFFTIQRGISGNMHNIQVLAPAA
ncbi:hypothetical protein C6P46_002191 [Rhodotorula mucilaginosa]|uniref:Uncharacterized protein n=1 Tax=Rhodotorula mucilaginosa TaxID=5537 RepID=A0A9P6VU52_RHOMI|nr:hypothetical protein C6P46_002191 [Rhodotorula mucilaginosa]